MITDLTQRWRDQRGTYRPAGEVINPAHYEVAPIPEREARLFVIQHHYSGSMPAARRCFGLFWGGLLVGVAVFSYPVNDLVITSVLPGKAIESVELGRLVLLDRVPGNGESWFVARCFELLRREGFIGVVSFSDPVRRVATTGKVIMPGHCGLVYQALNGVFTGRGKARTLRLLPDGTVFSERSMSKIRSGERGMVYASAQLVRAGAIPIDIEKVGEVERRVWLKKAVNDVTRPLPHGGNFRYVWTLHKRDRKYLPPAQPYPKLILASAA